jgi:hypothetical protein
MKHCMTGIDSALDALVLQSAQVAALGAPDDEALENLFEWLKRDDGGNLFQRGTELIGTWDRDNKRDFIALVPSSADRGGLSKLFRPWVTKFTFKLLSCSPWDFTVRVPCLACDEILIGPIKGEQVDRI